MLSPDSGGGGDGVGWASAASATCRLSDRTSEPEEPPQAASSMASRQMHAISGNIREDRCHADTGAISARVNCRIYLFIVQHPMFSQVEHRHDLHGVMPLEN